MTVWGIGLISNFGQGKRSRVKEEESAVRNTLKFRGYFISANTSENARLKLGSDNARGQGREVANQATQGKSYEIIP